MKSFENETLQKGAGPTDGAWAIRDGMSGIGPVGLHDEGSVLHMTFLCKVDYVSPGFEEVKAGADCNGSARRLCKNKPLYTVGRSGSGIFHVSLRRG